MADVKVLNDAQDYLSKATSAIWGAKWVLREQQIDLSSLKQAEQICRTMSYQLEQTIANEHNNPTLGSNSVPTKTAQQVSSANEMLQMMEQIFYTVESKLKDGDLNGAAQELRLAAEHLERGGEYPRVQHRDLDAPNGNDSMRTLSKLRSLVAHCASIAQAHGHRLVGLDEASQKGDFKAAKAILDGYVTKQHKLPAVSASWKQLEKTAAEWEGAQLLETVDQLRGFISRGAIPDARRAVGLISNQLAQIDPNYSPSERIPYAPEHYEQTGF